MREFSSAKCVKATFLSRNPTHLGAAPRMSDHTTSFAAGATWEHRQDSMAVAPESGRITTLVSAMPS